MERGVWPIALSSHVATQRSRLSSTSLEALCAVDGSLRSARAAGLLLGVWPSLWAPDQLICSRSLVPHQGGQHKLFRPTFVCGCPDRNSFTGWNGPRSDRHDHGAPRTLSESESKVIAGSNEFAFDLFRTVTSSAQSHVFMSPLSASMALGMTANGANGRDVTTKCSRPPPKRSNPRGCWQRLQIVDSAAQRTRSGNGLQNCQLIWYEQAFPFNASSSRKASSILTRGLGRLISRARRRFPRSTRG